MPSLHLFPEHRSPAFFAVISAIAAVCLAAGGLFCLYSWYAEISLLPQLLPGMTSLKVNTAAAFVLAGLSLWWQRAPCADPDAMQRLIKGIAQLLGLAIFLLGAATVSQDLFHINLHIDQLVFTA